MKLSDHFALEEFSKAALVPIESIPLLAEFCKVCLEPIRATYGPIVITSGNRPPVVNDAAGGVSNSQHIYTVEHVAADWYIPYVVMRPVFDWCRNNPKIQYDQLILEHGEKGDIIHASWSKTPRRMAMEGKTANQSAYTHFTSTPYQPQTA